MRAVYKEKNAFYLSKFAPNDLVMFKDEPYRVKAVMAGRDKTTGKAVFIYVLDGKAEFIRAEEEALTRLPPPRDAIAASIARIKASKLTLKGLFPFLLALFYITALIIPFRMFF